MKIFIFVLISLLLPILYPRGAAGAAPAVLSENEYGAQLEIKGDVNGDGRLNLSDCAALARFCADMTIPEFFLYQADLDWDGDGDITDLVILLRYLSGYDVSAAAEGKTVEPRGDHPGKASPGTEGKAPKREETLPAEDAGKKYLAAVDAAGKAYDEASETARAVFEAAMSSQPSQDEYNMALNAYKNAVANAREVYSAALEEAKTALNSAESRQP